MEQLFERSQRRIENTPVSFRRFLLEKIDFSQRLIGIKGGRGTGKTTMLLQQLKELPGEEVLYVSLDDVYFSSNNLVDLADQFYRIGGKYLYVDEVHKYKNWSREIKNIYDNHPGLNVVFTGSSAMELSKGSYDLSRRALIYELPGLSFREYLQFKYGFDIPAISLKELLYDNKEFSAMVLEKIRPYKYLSEYLQKGYYPYFKEDEQNYLTRLAATVNLAVETDLPAIYNINYNAVIKLKRLLYLIGSLVPFIPNLNKLAQQVGTTRDSLLKYLHLLHNAHILTWISREAWGINFMNKPDKLYLNNTNIAFALNAGKTDKGTMRETFFLNQTSVNHKITFPKQGDFMLDGEFVFEIGGKNKAQKQISDLEKGFIVSDDLEYPFKNRIPLWMFGFLY